jgi:outer membrane protein assembly factor BamA
MHVSKNGSYLLTAVIVMVMTIHIELVFAKDSTSTANDTVLDKSDETQTVDSKDEDFQEWVLFPVIASTAETGLILGGYAVRFFEPSGPDMQTNTIDFAAFGSIEEQYQVIVSPNIYFKDDLYHLDFSLSGEIWPANYYGIGNDTSEDDKEEYDSQAITTDLLLERRLIGNLYIGANYELKFEEVDPDADGSLKSDEITGYDGGVQSGVGLSLTLDTRDNPNDTRRGSFIGLQSNWFQPAFGSDFTFETYELYLRHFFSLTKNTGLALGGQLNMSRGDIPFRELNSPDGSELLRGIEYGRYRDRDMAGLQAEYRFPITGKWGGTIFAETAQVAHTIDQLNMDNWKYSIGGGIRYALNPSERFNIRLDLTLVDDDMGFVLNFREAF